MSDAVVVEARFELLDHVPMGMMVLRSDFVVLFWNRCLEDWTKISRSQVLGKPIGELFPHLRQAKYADRLQSIFEGGPPIIFSSQLHNYIIPAPLRGDQLRIQHTTVTAVPTLDGVGFCAMFAIQDVSDHTQRIRSYRDMRDQALAEARERQRAEDALRQSEEQYRALFESAKDAIFLVGQNGLVDCNPRAIEMFGRTREEMLGQFPRRFAPETQLDGSNSEEKGRELVNKALQGEPQFFMWRHARADGSTFDASVSLNRVDLADQAFIQVIIRDVTKQQRVEQSLRQRNQELAMLNRASQAFNSILSLDEVLVVILEEIRRLLEVDACSVWLTDPVSGELVCQQATGSRSDVIRGWRLQAGEGIAGWVAQHGESLVIEDALQDARYFGGPAEQTGLILRSVLSVPLRFRQRVIGVLQVVDREPGRFDEAQLGLLESLVTSAAIAIENAQLFEQAQQEILERKRAEDESRRLKEFNEGIVQNMAEGIVIEDIDGFFTFFNPAASQMLGYLPEQLEGVHLTKVIPLDQRSIIEAADQRRLEGQTDQYEVELMRADGQRIVVLIRGSPRFENGEFVGTLAVFTNITERKQAAAERERIFAILQRRTNQLQTAADVSKSAITMLDPAELMDRTVRLIHKGFDFYFVGLFLVNDSAEFAVLKAGTGKAGQQMLEAEHKLEVGGASMVGWCTAHGEARVALDVGAEGIRFDNLLLPNTRSEVALPLISHTSGCLGALSVQSTQEAAFSKEDVAVLQTMADQLAIAIENARLYAETQRQLLEQTALREAAAVISSALDTKTVLSRIAEQMGRSVGATSSFIASYDSETGAATVLAEHASAHASEGERGFDLGVKYPTLAPDFIEMMQAGYHDISHLDDPALPEYERQHMVEFGAQTVLYIPLLIRGQLNGFAELWESRRRREFTSEEIGLCQGIAQQAAIAIENARLYERISRHAAELEKHVAERTAELAALNKELEAFSYSVSHDLRAPLRSIDGFSLALIDDYANVLDEAGLDHLRRVRTASQRMGHLIDALLTLSRVTRREMFRKDVDISALAEAVAIELRESEPQRDVEFNIKAGLTVRGDERLLRVVLENLMGNAWKFTGNSGQARIEFGNATIDGTLTFFVRDNGAGFNMSYADRLFGAFQRLHSKAEFPGTGIGLATVQRIILRHGGRVWAESAEGEGAIFYFTLFLKENPSSLSEKSYSPNKDNLDVKLVYDEKIQNR